VSDARLRRLERRWQETRSLDDEAALLRERARAGVISPARLRVASALGHSAARLVAPRPLLPVSFDGFDAPLYESGHPDWTPWEELLRDAGREVAVRMALPVAELGLAMCRELVPLARAAPVPELEAVLDTARAWTDDPCTERRDAVQGALQIAHTLVVNEELMWSGTTTVISAGSVVTEPTWPSCLRETVWWYATPGGSRDEARLRGAYQAIVEAVVPWALSP